jgi:WD40 repeat protein
MTHLRGISKVAAEAKVAAAEAKVATVGSARIFECQSTMNGHSDEVNGVCFSPDGFKLASCSDDRSVKIWNLITRECVSTLTVDSIVHSVAFSPDGSKIAAAHSYKIQLFDAQPQAKHGSQLSGHSDR